MSFEAAKPKFPLMPSPAQVAAVNAPVVMPAATPAPPPPDPTETELMLSWIDAVTTLLGNHPSLVTLALWIRVKLEQKK